MGCVFHDFDERFFTVHIEVDLALQLPVLLMFAEYLLFKLVHNLGPERRNVRIFHEQDALTRLLTALHNLQASHLK
jgi:hypothetical protein